MTTASILRRSIPKAAFFLHGTRLLLPGAAIWLVSMFVLAGATAILEGITWAYVTAQYLPAPLSQVALLLGLLVGGGVFLWDASFVTLDVRAPARRDGGADGTAPGTAPARRRVAWLARGEARSALLRVVVILVSLLVTSPLIVRALQARSLEDARLQHNARQIAQGRQQLAAAHDAQVQAVKAQIGTERERLIREISGLKHHSTTGKGGKGPAARALEKQLILLDADLAAAVAAREAALTAFDRATPETLATTHGVVLLADNATSRALLREQLAAVEDRILGLPADHVVAFTVVLLMAVFLIGLKLNQPDSVALYFDEALQCAFQTYRRGGYAHLPRDILPAVQQHDAPCALDGLEFEHWFDGRYLPQRAALAAAEAHAAQVELHRAAVERAQAQLDEACVDTHHAQRELEADLALLGSAEEELGRQQADLARQERHLMELDNDILRTRRQELEEQRAQLLAERADLKERHAQLAHEREACAGRLAEIVEAIRLEMAREGHLSELSAWGAGPATAAVQPLMARRGEERQHKEGLTRQMLALEHAMQEADASIAACTDALAQRFDTAASDFGALEPMLGDLRQQREAGRIDRDRQQVRVQALQSQVTVLADHVAERRLEAQRCAAQRQEAAQTLRSRQQGLARTQDAAILPLAPPSQPQPQP
jgi:hypothetical protein